MRGVRLAAKNTKAPVVTRGYKIILNAVRTSIIIYPVSLSTSFHNRRVTAESKGLEP
jgi:hypothetical protein